MLDKSHRALGATPIFKEGEDVFDKFTYVFSTHEDSGPLFDLNAGQWLKEECEGLSYVNEISDEKKWWVYALLVLGKSFKNESKLLGSKVCSRTLSQVEDLSVDELEQRVNMIALAHNEYYPYFFHPRISMMKELNSVYCDQPPFLHILNSLDGVYAMLLSSLSISYLRPAIIKEVKSIETFTNPIFWVAEYILTDLAFNVGAIQEDQDIAVRIEEIKDNLGLLLSDISYIESYDIEEMIDKVLMIVDIEEALRLSVTMRRGQQVA